MSNSANPSTKSALSLTTISCGVCGAATTAIQVDATKPGSAFAGGAAIVGR
jgi:hypothetical protein